MTVPRLERIKIENFRSINQRIDVPLNAPVVLIHGSNGTGKTSLLSAIELVLTGRVPSLQQADKDYAKQLLHRGATNGYVELSVSGLESIDEPLKLRIGQQGPIDNVRIDRDRAHFFSERCYLPQARLGRLLEIYQTAGDSTHSPLTLFVHDLLELDRLDALIDGLEPAHHVTRIRKLVPEYKETEQAKQRLEERLSGENVDLSEAEARAESLIGQLTENLRQLHPDLASSRMATDNRAALEGRLAEDAEGKALLQLADYERTLAAMRRRWERIAQMPGARERASLESSLQKASAALDHWRNVEGKQLDATVEQVRIFFPELATSTATNPQHALEAARNRVEFDRTQVSAQVEHASTDAKRLEELEDALAHATSRLDIVDREIANVAAHVGDLAAALAALAPHIQGDECPVCGRDFAELDEGSLAVHVASEVVRLGEQSERLQVLERDRASLRAQVAKDVNERDAIKKRTLAEDRLFQLKQRLAKLEEAAAALVGLEKAASRGFDLIKREAEAR